MWESPALKLEAPPWNEKPLSKRRQTDRLAQITYKMWVYMEIRTFGFIHNPSIPLQLRNKQLDFKTRKLIIHKNQCIPRMWLTRRGSGLMELDQVHTMTSVGQVEYMKNSTDYTMQFYANMKIVSKRRYPKPTEQKISKDGCKWKISCMKPKLQEIQPQRQQTRLNKNIKRNITDIQWQLGERQNNRKNY